MGLFGFGKKKESHSDIETFRARVEAFWGWWSNESESMLEAIDEGRCGDLSDVIAERMSAVWPPLAWVFGPPPEGVEGHSFTITGEGVKDRQFLAEAMVAMAPDLPGWTFHASRQAGLDVDGRLDIHGEQVLFTELWVVPNLDLEEEKIHIEAMHPCFARLDNDSRFGVLFLILDEVLGEHGVGQWIGQIETVTELAEGTKAVPIAELRDYLSGLQQEHGWQKLPPTETYVLYQRDAEAGWPRGDIAIGQTRHEGLLGSSLQGQGFCEEDELAGSGAEYAYVSFPSSILPAGGEVEFRGGIEDALTAALAAGSGELLGGATGGENCYLDLLLLDGDRSLQIVEATLKEQGLPNGSAIQFFQRGQEGRRRFL